MSYFTFAMLFAQVVVTLRFVAASTLSLFPTATHYIPRVYAVTGKNRRIASYLTSVALIQFAFGIYLTIRFGLLPRTSLFISL